MKVFLFFVMFDGKGRQNNSKILKIRIMFKNIFGSKKEKKEEVNNVTWFPLTSAAQIEEIVAESKTKAVGVFKHSTRCSISTTVAKRFEKSYPKDADIKMYFIDLLNYREVSQEIGFKFQVVHQSPQFLLIKDGKAVKHASHYDILELNLND